MREIRFTTLIPNWKRYFLARALYGALRRKALAGLRSGDRCFFEQSDGTVPQITVSKANIGACQAKKKSLDRRSKTACATYSLEKNKD